MQKEKAHPQNNTLLKNAEANAIYFPNAQCVIGLTSP